jgi:hypothetical protein
MAEKFVKGEKLSPEKVAAELVPILAMWGISRGTAAEAAWSLWRAVSNMSPADYEKAAKGMKIKAGLPNHAKPKDN